MGWICPDCGRRWGTPAGDCGYCRPAEFRRERASAASLPFYKQWTYHGVIAPQAGPFAGEVAVPLQIRWRTPVLEAEPGSGTWESLHRLARQLARESDGSGRLQSVKAPPATAVAMPRPDLPARKAVLSAVALGVLATLLAILTQLR